MSFRNCKIVGVGVNSDDYHTQGAERGTPEYRLSSSAMREFYRCPARWKAGYELPASKARRYGNMLDTLFLTPDQFDDRYSATPKTYVTTVMECPQCGSQTDSKKCRKCGCERAAKVLQKEWNNNATECAAWRENQGDKEIISWQELQDIHAAVQRLRADEVICNFVDASEKQVHIEGEWLDAATGVVIPVKCLIDLVPGVDTEFATCLADFKTDSCAALIPFQRHCFDRGYHIQAEFYRAMYLTATGEGDALRKTVEEEFVSRSTWCFIVQENYSPFQVGKRILDRSFMQLGRDEYQTMLGLYARCVKSGVWPGYDDSEEAVQGWSVVSPESWMQSRGMFAARLAVPDEADESDVPT